jgi:predicted esterase YcpF (UPF0227 family)
LIILLHGFGVKKADDSLFVKRFKKLYPDEIVLAPDYPIKDADATCKQLEDYTKKAKKNYNATSVTYAGISMGGFWARYLANKDIESRILLFNPAMRLHLQLMRYSHINKMSEKTCMKFKQYAIEKDRKDLRGLVFCSRDDDISPVQFSIEAFELNTNIQLYISETGGHQLVPDIIEKNKKLISLYAF